MDKILMRRQRGKTTAAINKANETGAYLVVRNMQVVQQIMNAEHLPKPKRYPVTYAEVLNDGMNNSFVRNIVIDDLDAFAQAAVGNLTIDAITMDLPEVGILEGSHVYPVDDNTSPSDKEQT